MPNYQIVSSGRHAGKRWLRHSDYRFASQYAVVPLALAELPKAAMTLPIALIEQDGTFVPAAVLGLEPERSLFVAADGQWQGGYIPAGLRAYPFRLAATDQGQQVLCVDEDSGLVTEDLQGEAFFDEHNEPTPAIREILSFLEQTASSGQAAKQACDSLKQCGVVSPWPITVTTSEGDRNLGGLFQIDEAALTSLEPAALHELMRAGALPAAYCQLLSTQHLSRLGELARLKAAEIAASTSTNNSGYANDSGTFTFGNLT
ncbi:SapC family protein [Stutzerimonas zhaodongensis]|uniref:SapC family protein n=1 Tax=Stutzerimonas zhaodongensis TaxID=1176257 RepID=A0ABX8J0C4_9GAMM|nr:SapC family protein [Stutzerimonas zhaodongensis]QWV18498.1 SapC family protein [Stutzerimonas zhaodongensis]